VKPASFDYFAPKSLDEALAFLAEHGDDARVLAGGQSLVPLMNLRLAQPAVLVDVNQIAELADGGPTRDGGYRLGALTRQAQLERSTAFDGAERLLVEACAQIGHLPIRHRGTVGGNLAHADPASELPAALLALEARFELRSQQQQRQVRAEEFFLGALTTALRPDELLCEIRLPGSFRPDGPPRESGGAFVEVARRRGDYALVGVAAVISLDQAGTVTRARIALCGAAPTPIRAPAAEAALVGRPPSGEALREAAERAAEATDPASDVHASAAFRRRLARVCTRQAIELASQRAVGV
jgi:CO/xanthine dehydrogenase FAD-binding subunit